MKIVRALALLVAAALVGIALFARSADGPFGPFPGGALVSGRLVEAPVADSHPPAAGYPGELWFFALRPGTPG
jgi:hypothetical protein